MSALAALKAAEAAGISIGLEGHDLLLEAASPPSPVIIEALSHHKTAIAQLLLAARSARHQVRRNPRQLHTRNLNAEWADGLAILSLASPAEGFSSQDWRRLVEDAGFFIDAWGDKAAELGWGILDVFGVHRSVPAARYDGMGLVPLVRGGKIVALDRDRATIRMRSGGEVIYLKRPLQDAVPIWTVAPSQPGTAR